MRFKRLSSKLWNLRYVFLFTIIKCPCASIVFVFWIHNCESHVTIFTSLYLFGETIEKCQLPRLVRSVSGVRMEKSRPLKHTELANQIWGFRTTRLLMLEKKLTELLIVWDLGREVLTLIFSLVHDPQHPEH